jgi:hypothetical protein
MNRRISCLTLLVSLAVAPAARAQQVTNLPRGTEQTVGVEAGLDSAFIVRGTYAHALPGFLRDAAVYARFTLPFAEADFGDFSVDAGVIATVAGSDRWKLQLLFGPELRQTSNDAFSATALGFRSGMLAGYRSDTWGLMAELGYEQVLATHISHSALYRDTVYAGAKDGWYAITGGTFTAGLRGGGRVGRVELYGALGVMTSTGLELLVPPAYAVVGSTYAF